MLNPQEIEKSSEKWAQWIVREAPKELLRMFRRDEDLLMHWSLEVDRAVWESVFRDPDDMREAELLVEELRDTYPEKFAEAQ